MHKILESLNKIDVKDEVVNSNTTLITESEIIDNAKLKESLQAEYKPAQWKQEINKKTLEEGASVDSIAHAIMRRLEARRPEVFSKYGVEYVNNAVQNVASFHEGAEELGTSDISIMVREVLKDLAEKIDESTSHNTKYGVRIRYLNKKGQIVIKEVWFTSNEARAKYLIDCEDGKYGGFLNIESWADHNESTQVGDSENHVTWNKINRNGDMPHIDKYQHTDLNEYGTEQMTVPTGNTTTPTQPAAQGSYTTATSQKVSSDPAAKVTPKVTTADTSSTPDPTAQMDALTTKMKAPGFFDTPAGKQVAQILGNMK